MKKDVVHSGLVGSLIGLALAALVVCVAWASGWTETRAGWIPSCSSPPPCWVSASGKAACSACRPSAVFKRFEQRLHEGKHVFFVDVKPTQEAVLQQVVSHHPMLRMAGTGSARRIGRSPSSTSCIACAR